LHACPYMDIPFLFFIIKTEEEEEEKEKVRRDPLGTLK
jgi:hypothetical protein